MCQRHRASPEKEISRLASGEKCQDKVKQRSLTDGSSGGVNPGGFNSQVIFFSEGKEFHIFEVGKVE